MTKGIRVSKARVLVAEKNTKAIVGGDWLTALRCKVVHSTEEVENSINCVSADQVNPEVELLAAVKQLAEELPKLFQRRGCNNKFQLESKRKKTHA